MNKLIFDFDHESDSGQRIQILKHIDQMVIENNWIIPIYHRREAVVFPKDFTGFTDDFKGTALVYPEKWSIHE